MNAEYTEALLIWKQMTDSCDCPADLSNFGTHRHHMKVVSSFPDTWVRLPPRRCSLGVHGQEGMLSYLSTNCQSSLPPLQHISLLLGKGLRVWGAF
uniref:Uncharacterized protein n=1 Tax=Anguilla anguilla TaxID=7936 RepID=A0A0E9XQD5_ANGAN